MRRRVVSLAFVYTSASGLPLASVSNGTAAGMFEPRKRTYWEAATAGMRHVIVRNVLPSTLEVTVFHAVAPLALKVLSTAAVVFFAASGTESKPVVVPSAFNQSVLAGHAPAYPGVPGVR